MRWGDTSPGCRKLQEGIVVTTVLICDDRRSVREGLTRVMSAVPGVHRIDCVAHGDELLARFSRQPVDVVLVGTQRAVPIGVEATRRLVAAHPQANVIEQRSDAVGKRQLGESVWIPRPATLM